MRCLCRAGARKSALKPKTRSSQGVFLIPRDEVIILFFLKDIEENAYYFGVEALSGFFPNMR